MPHAPRRAVTGALVCLLAAALATAAPKRPVDILLLTDLSGASQSWGTQSRAVAQAAVAFFNARSANVSMRLICADSRSSADGAFGALLRATASAATAGGAGDGASSATMALADAAPRAIIAPRSSAQVAQVAMLTRLRHIPMIGASATAAPLAGLPLLARTVPSDGERARALLHLARHFRWQQLALLHAGGLYGRAFADTVERWLMRGGDDSSSSSSSSSSSGSNSNPLWRIRLRVNAAVGTPSLQSVANAEDWRTLVSGVDAALDAVAAAGTRVVLLAVAPGAEAAFVLARAARRGMAGVKGWTWLSPEWASSGDRTWRDGVDEVRRRMGALGVTLDGEPTARSWLTRGAVKAAMAGALGVEPFHDMADLHRIGVSLGGGGNGSGSNSSGVSSGVSSSSSSSSSSSGSSGSSGSGGGGGVVGNGGRNITAHARSRAAHENALLSALRSEGGGEAAGVVTTPWSTILPHVFEAVWLLGHALDAAPAATGAELFERMLRTRVAVP